jgi:hypothetical protein
MARTADQMMRRLLGQQPRERRRSLPRLSQVSAVVKQCREMCKFNLPNDFDNCGG